MRRPLVPAAIVLCTLAALLAGPAASAAEPAPDGCDPIAAEQCLLPFPNDWYTRTDTSTDTGRRVALSRETLPRSAVSGTVNPAAWNRSDGFSPGSTLIAQVPGVDLFESGAAQLTDIGRSLRPDAPIVLLDTTTGQRWPYWAELDANATRPDRQALLIHPAKNFADGHHYAVALRNLKDATGATLPKSAAFARLDGPTLPAGDELRARQDELAPVLAQLTRANVAPGELQLAWDFTVASTRNLTGDLLATRDKAFAELGDQPPAYKITGVTGFTEAESPQIAREVNGVLQVPSYLDRTDGTPGSFFQRGADGTPERIPGNTQQAEFRCEIPRAAFAEPSRASLYGHGLFGSYTEVSATDVENMAAEHDFTFCATDWIGMAQADVPNVLRSLADPSQFASIPERTQQGIVNAMFLGRALTHPRGLGADPAFRTESGGPLIASDAGLSYDGNSQGGILGGALIAASPEIRRGVLGVTGMNYSLLLNRSADFTSFQNVLNLSYPDKVDQQVILSLYQMLWDRGETDGYANDLTGTPLPGTPRHEVLMQIAFGDHQVANVASDVEARTLGARLVTPALAPGRAAEQQPYWGITPAGPLPSTGSAMSVWDSGTPAPPLLDQPPEAGLDPHGDPRNMATARQQKAAFLKEGTVIDVCGGKPCVAAPAG